MTDINDRRDPDRQIFRDLYTAIDGLERRFNDLKPLLEDVAVLATRVQTSVTEIDRLRDKVDHLSSDMAGLISQIQSAKKDTSGLSPSWVAVVLSLIGFILTALFNVV